MPSSFLIGYTRELYGLWVEHTIPNFFSSCIVQVILSCPPLAICTLWCVQSIRERAAAKGHERHIPLSQPPPTTLRGETLLQWYLITVLAKCPILRYTQGWVRHKPYMSAEPDDLSSMECLQLLLNYFASLPSVVISGYWAPENLSGFLYRREPLVPISTRARKNPLHVSWGQVDCLFHMWPPVSAHHL